MPRYTFILVHPDGSPATPVRADLANDVEALRYAARVRTRDGDGPTEVLQDGRIVAHLLGPPGARPDPSTHASIARSIDRIEESLELLRGTQVAGLHQSPEVQQPAPTTD